MSRGNSGGGPKSIPPISDVLPIAVRTYGLPEDKQADKVEFSSRGPSKRFLIFDTETTTDETQGLRIGAYQIRYGDEPKEREKGMFFNPAVLTPEDRRVLESYAAAKRLKLITLREFRDKIFVRVGYHWQATNIGFNLPFDLARLAEGHSDARGKMRPGFSLETAPRGQKGPRVRIRHISRASLMEFSGPGQRLPRGQKKREVIVPLRRPAFVDVSPLAHALLSKPFSLKDLAKFLETPHQKLDQEEEHGKPLTPEYLDYAVQDVQVTWECFVELRKRLDEHGLTRTPIHRIYSEASIGKGYLREMGVRPWREKQPDFPPALIGKIMGTYFGGRTEVHQRRVITQVQYCDFTSMYPTVSTLMGLWPFVIAKRMTWRDATAETQEFVKKVTLADLQRPETWRRLHVIVQIEPDGDILPVRAKYEYEPIIPDEKHKHYTIGLNHLTSDQPLWCALPDVIGSKLLNNGRVPKILNAIAFEAGEPQDGLRPVNIAGKTDFRVDPLKDDFFKRLIELRMQTQEKQAKNALKLVANASGYGIFVQMDVNERSEPVAIHCYPATGRQFLVDMKNIEQPGEFFHPLIGTLIASAARLMLAITERLVIDFGLEWTFCDTDSMAIAKPAGMTDPEFFKKAQAVRDWFKPLNPYGVEVDLFKAEDENFGIKDGELTKELEPLYCFAISSKRYVLFNINSKGEPVIRKATAHGLGYLLPPYKDAQPDLPQPIFPVKDLVDEIGVNLWQHDFWHCIVRAVLAGNSDRPDFSALPNFDQPAVTKYAATTPHLLDWFERYNRNKTYSKQVRPFNFIKMCQPDPLADWEDWRLANGLDSKDTELPHVIAPYDKNLITAMKRCFDRDTGKPVPAKMLKSYAQALAQYHLRPETKFLNADYTDTGTTQRRHVKVEAVIYIGKEANRWEEQSHIGGIAPEPEITYGRGSRDRKRILDDLLRTADKFGQRVLAKAAKISLQHLLAIMHGSAVPAEKILAKLQQVSKALYQAQADADAVLEKIRAKCEVTGLRKFAKKAGIDSGNLASILKRRRKASSSILKRLARRI